MAPTPTTENSNVSDVRLVDALSERYLSYALSTIMSRSLPDVRDGLKPVHRRLLHAMQLLRLDPEHGYKKAARVVGDVMGKFHPHGDQAIYDAMVRMAQGFSLRYPLVDGQGNFGNIDGDNAAAMRYTEARLTSVAMRLLEGIDEDAVDFRPTYDGESQEPVVLPAAFPNLLANGAQGIAVGMATAIPPHNVSEICGALRHLIAHPEAEVAKLVEYLPAPDFPTGGILVESADSILETYSTGRGSFRLRARWETESLKGGTYQIIVTEIPYQVPKARLVEKIADLLAAKKLTQLADVRDESDENVRLVLEPRSRNVDPQVLMESLYRQTDLETRVSLNMNVLDADNTPRVMTLREVLQAFLTHRETVLLRRTRNRLEQIAKRLEVLSGYLIAFLNLDEVIRIIREEDDPKAELIRTFELSDTQADAILNMRLRSLRRLEEMELRREHERLIEEQGELNHLLEDSQKRWQVIDSQIADLQEEFSTDTPLGRRHTEIGSAPEAVVIPLEAVIDKEPVTVLLSEKGWIRALKGHHDDLSETRYKDGDRGKHALKAYTTDKILLFATNGRFYTLGADKLPGGRGFGEPLRLSIDLPNDQDIVALKVYTPSGQILLASDDGRGFAVSENDVVAQTKNGKQALNPAKGVEASVCRPISEGDDSVAVIGENRKLLIFPRNELPEMARGRGVILQRYKDGGLSDIKTFRLEDGLTWAAGPGRVRTEHNLMEWQGKRGQSGRLAPRGFSSSNRFD
ncbi:MAG: DNA topoisomerase IV subunit A [Pseudomonadota bacterium]